MAHSEFETTEPKWNFADWMLRAAVGFVFIAIGWEKFTANPHSEWFKIFAKIGFGQWFRYFTGVLQVTGGALMIVPRTVLIGAALLGCTMVGAILAHIFFLGDPSASVFPLGLLIAIVLIGRRKSKQAEEMVHLDL
jgi:uncharacterized membrane protein YphA (DoxX/SURF4 family)